MKRTRTIVLVLLKPCQVFFILELGICLILKGLSFVELMWGYTDSLTRILTSPLLARLPGVEHGFGTRHSEISQDGMASLKQVHSARVLMASGAGCAGEADALITATPGLAVSVRTADCFPILLCSPARRVVAAVHAGWRGTAEKIIQAAMQKMHAQFGASPPEIFAAIGPGIGACCYRVGEDVARRFGLAQAGNIDLAAENQRQLIESGVPPDNIEVLALCTFCDPERFYSYRRDPADPGRMISFIGIR